MNLLFKGYEVLDLTIMKCVNAGVKAYNWTTGGTKADLANELMTIYGISAATGASVSKGLDAFFSPFPLFVAHIFQKSFRDMESQEDIAKNQGTKDLQVEWRKFLAKILGPVLFLTGSYVVTNSIFKESKTYDEDIGRVSMGLTGISLISMGSAMYVIRADDLPPQKNCFSRGADHLKKIVDSYKPQPKVSTIPVNQSQYESIDCLVG